jgi:nucleoside-diphosphate-sugar epimerase
MLALVTGAGGFLGRYIAEMLAARGDAVRSLARGSYPFLAELGVEQIAGDLRDPSAVERATAGAEVVFHTAAIAGIGGRWADFHAINTLGTQHVVEACRRHRVRRLVYTSSPSVTFDGRDQCGVDESAPYPASFLAHYPRSKALAEQQVLAANNGEDLLTCALRPHLIWGPRDQHLIPRLLDRARQGKLRIVGNGENRVDMIYVENAAVAHLQAADALRPGAAICGRAYFLSQGEAVNCWDWINEILALAELPPVTRRISYPAAYAAGAMLEAAYWLLGRADEPRMTRFLAAQLATSHWFDISRAREDFGYQPQVSTAAGMQRLKAWLHAGSPTR